MPDEHGSAGPRDAVLRPLVHVIDADGPAARLPAARDRPPAGPRRGRPLGAGALRRAAAAGGPIQAVGAARSRARSQSTARPVRPRSSRGAPGRASWCTPPLPRAQASPGPRATVEVRPTAARSSSRVRRSSTGPPEIRERASPRVARARRPGSTTSRCTSPTAWLAAERHHRLLGDGRRAAHDRARGSPCRATGFGRTGR